MVIVDIPLLSEQLSHGFQEVVRNNLQEQCRKSFIIQLDSGAALWKCDDVLCCAATVTNPCGLSDFCIKDFLRGWEVFGREGSNEGKKRKKRKEEKENEKRTGRRKTRLIDGVRPNSTLQVEQNPGWWVVRVVGRISPFVFLPGHFIFSKKKYIFGGFSWMAMTFGARGVLEGNRMREVPRPRPHLAKPI